MDDPSTQPEGHTRSAGMKPKVDHTVEKPQIGSIREVQNRAFHPLICPLRHKREVNKLALTLKVPYGQKHVWA